MKLRAIDVPPRIVTKLTRDFRVRGQLGYVSYGTEDDYPRIMERLILGSPTGVAASRVLASFLVGEGFTDAMVNKVVVGRDNKGKPLTAYNILEAAAMSIARYNGFYIRVDIRISPSGKVVVPRMRPLPFGDMRIGRPDEEGYAAYVYDISEPVGREDHVTGRLEPYRKYSIFSTSPTIAEAVIGDATTSGVVFFEYFDSEYFYPLSVFDAVAYELDNEQQAMDFRNNTIRNDFHGLTMIGTPPVEDKESGETLEEQVRAMIGGSSTRIFTYEMTDTPEGGIDTASVLKIDNIPMSVHPDLYNSWEQISRGAIRRAAYGMPEMLMDVERNNSMGGHSGEAYKQAVEIYNLYTDRIRRKLAESLKECLGAHPDLVGRDLSISELRADALTITAPTTTKPVAP